MAVDSDGRIVCDRCLIRLDGYGVLYGLIATDIDSDGAADDRIYCYQDGCRDVAIAGLDLYPNQIVPPRCTTCLVDLPALSPAYGMICADLDPATGDSRRMAFCDVNGHHLQFLTQGDA